MDRHRCRVGSAGYAVAASHEQPHWRSVTATSNDSSICDSTIHMCVVAEALRRGKGGNEDGASSKCCLTVNTIH